MLSLTQAAEQIRTRELSPVELTRECLGNIERLNPKLNSFITVTADLALEQARRAEDEISQGNYRGPLHGIPIALKDNIDTAGVRTTAGSNQYRERVPTEDAEIVRQLKMAGAVIVGKTNMHEFAFGGSGVVSAFGPARNPVDAERITGGSSSGTAAAVAAGMCVAAIGTDTAGSVRCPAALCGVVGHRPSQGVLSNTGTIPLAESFDTPGPITRTVADARLLLQALAPVGCTTLWDSHASEQDLSKLRIGVARNLTSDMHADVTSCFESAVEILVKLVAQTQDVKVAVEAPWDVRNFEIFHYHQEMFEQIPKRYDRRTLDRIRASAGVSELDYVRKRAAWKANNAALGLLSQVDLIISPTVPVAAPLVAELEAMDSAALRAYEMKHLLRNTIPFSFLWWPSVSVPCGMTQTGLPLGLQISGGPGADLLVLQLAEAFEQAKK
jgi:aspartyl-tRNA(Asn)/glutamyl-tRNA(Gln) amidotransferase subunit A